MTSRLVPVLSFVSGILWLLGGCAAGSAPADCQRLIDGGSGIENFHQVGTADWVARDGAVQATRGGREQSFLVTGVRYRDVRITAEFWASDDANSGVFIRCQDPIRITDESCYEANIFDQRPDPTFGTGAITKVAKAPVPMPKAGGQWNVYEVTALGDHLSLKLNGVTTASAIDNRFASGPIALQWAKGTIKFRRLEVCRI